MNKKERAMIKERLNRIYPALPHLEDRELIEQIKAILDSDEMVQKSHTKKAWRKV